jgi:type IV secretory pathway VirB2 component (pilin)
VIQVGDDISKLISIFFVGAIAVLIVTHAASFSTSAGSIFTGLNGLARSLTGPA